MAVEKENLILTKEDNSVSIYRGDEFLASIPGNKLSARTKRSGTGIDILQAGKIITGGLYGKVIVNGTVLTKDNAGDLINGIVKECGSGGGSGDNVSFSDITGSPTDNEALRDTLDDKIPVNEGVAENLNVQGALSIVGISIRRTGNALSLNTDPSQDIDIYLNGNKVVKHTDSESVKLQDNANLILG